MEKSKMFTLSGGMELELSVFKYIDEWRYGLAFDYDEDFIRKLKQVPGVRYSRSKSLWHIPRNQSSVEALERLGISLRAGNHKTPRKTAKAPTKKRSSIPIDLSLIKHDKCRMQVRKTWEYMLQKRYAGTTINTYLHLLFHFVMDLEISDVSRVSLQNINDYNYRMIHKKNASYSYQNQWINAIKLCLRVNDADLDLEQIERPMRRRKLPVVLSREEVKHLLDATSNVKHRLLLSFVYGLGLRIGEALSMRLTDIDSDRMLVRIANAKGGKDRMVPIGKNLLQLARRYFRAYRPKHFLFEGQKGGRYSNSSARSILKRSLRKARIKKKTTLHTLRHSYATHLLEQGVDIRYIQSILGHNSPKTTMIYTHVSSQKLGEIKSPVEDLIGD